MTRKELIQHLRSKIREFEDRKISGADLARVVYFVAREMVEAEDIALRRALEAYGNRINVHFERGEQVHAKILEVVDQIQGELI